MPRVELLLPAGGKDCLRAAVANGADAVYLGLDSFNARRSAENFTAGTLPSVVSFCHAKGVRVHVTANVLVKNGEMRDYLGLVQAVGCAGADAVIVQDPWLIPLVREAAPDCEVHLSTQSTTNNAHAVPEGVDRVILPREMSIAQISAMAKRAPVETFVHGALCLSYSGQCLFSSIAGGRSGNRGGCAQPCRRKYNGSYPLSTKDLCLLERLTDIIGTGATALKVEGRLRSPLYVGTVARIYRKYIDMHYSKKFKVDPRDVEDLRLAFSRDFTTGFAFNDSVVDASASTNRGVPLGRYDESGILLEAELCVGDGVMALDGAVRSGNIVNRIVKGGKEVDRASRGEVVQFDVKGAKAGDRLFKNLSADLDMNLGDDFPLRERAFKLKPVKLPPLASRLPEGGPVLHVGVRDIRGAEEAARSGTDIIYYDIFADDIGNARKASSGARFFLRTPRIMSDADIDDALRIMERAKPDGLLAGDRGMAAAAKSSGTLAGIHLDTSLNVFNDIDIDSCGGVPIISPELSYNELAGFRSKKIIVPIHGPLVLMTTKEQLGGDPLVDEANRTFRIRRVRSLSEITNCSDLGLFNLSRGYLDAGFRWFFLDLDRSVGKLVKAYRRILSGEPFDDRKIRKGCTTGHFRRGVD